MMLVKFIAMMVVVVFQMSVRWLTKTMERAIPPWTRSPRRVCWAPVVVS